MRGVSDKVVVFDIDVLLIESVLDYL